MTNPSRFQQREDVNSPESASLLGRLLASDGLRCWKRGVLDALSFHRGVPFVLKSPLIRQRTAQCFLLNGIIFVGSILLYHHAIAPALDVLLRTEFLDLLAYVNVGPGETRDDDSNQDDGGVGVEAGRAARGSLGLGVEAADVEGAGDVGVAGDEQDWDPGAGSGSDTKQRQFQSPVLNLFSFLYKILWLYPIYCISFVLNTVAYQDIADCCQPETGDRISPQSFQARIVDETFRILLNLIYISCSQILYYLVPYVGKPFYFVCFCWLASLYCFEYRWVYLGWTSRERLSYFENHWLYFAGFGFPIAAVSYVSPAYYPSFNPLC
eukprot:g8625.t1